MSHVRLEIQISRRVTSSVGFFDSYISESKKLSNKIGILTGSDTICALRIYDLGVSPCRKNRHVRSRAPFSSRATSQVGFFDIACATCAASPHAPRRVSARRHHGRRAGDTKRGRRPPSPASSPSHANIPLRYAQLLIIWSDCDDVKHLYQLAPRMTALHEPRPPQVRRARTRRGARLSFPAGPPRRAQPPVPARPPRRARPPRYRRLLPFRHSLMTSGMLAMETAS